MKIKEKVVVKTVLDDHKIEKKEMFTFTQHEHDIHSLNGETLECDKNEVQCTNVGEK